MIRHFIIAAVATLYGVAICAQNTSEAWTLSAKDKYYEWDSPHQAEHYYKYMSDVILYLCSVNNKAEANKFLNHYSFWFYTRIDSSSYYSERYPGFRYDVVKSNLQRIINTY